MGLRLLGPRVPHGRQAAPWPAELPADSGNVPTFHHSMQTPETATRQLDFVFATENIADRVQVRALNSVGGWGPSDHCRVAINVDLRRSCLSHSAESSLNSDPARTSTLRLRGQVPGSAGPAPVGPRRSLPTM
jgi:hypothetical protein